jgi:cytochrome c-type biogenesis protein CcmH
VQSNAVQLDTANIDIYRDQISEMSNDLNNGLLTQEMYDQGQQELQTRLLDDVEQSKGINTKVVTNPFRVLALVLTILLPLSATLIYLKIGNPDVLSPQQNASTGSVAVAHSAAELAALEEQVSSKPDDANSWYVLAKSYGEMGRYPDAVNAYDKLTQLVPNEAQLWADYADSMAMASGKSLSGKPAMLLEKALQLDPDNFKALALSGSAAMERKDYAAAVSHWEKLLKKIPKGNENAQIVEGGIHQARVLMAQKNGDRLPPPMQFSSPDTQARTGAGKEAISGTVTLSDELKSRTSPDDTVFVLVRAASGPKMPLAIVRKQVRDLPLKFTLDDSTSMSPQMKVSNFDQVVVIARVSKSGNAMTQPGDMQVMSATIKPGSKGLKLKIDQLVQ